MVVQFKDEKDARRFIRNQNTLTLAMSGFNDIKRELAKLDGLDLPNLSEDEKAEMEVGLHLAVMCMDGLGKIIMKSRVGFLEAHGITPMKAETEFAKATLEDELRCRGDASPTTRRTPGRSSARCPWERTCCPRPSPAIRESPGGGASPPSTS